MRSHAGKRKRIRRLAWVLVPAALLYFAPWLLSTRPLLGVLEGLLSRRARAQVKLESAGLSWSGPTIFRDLSMTSRQSVLEPWFLAERIEFDRGFAALWLGEAPVDLCAERARLRLPPEPSGGTPLSDWLDRAGRERLLERAGRSFRLELRDSSLLIGGRSTDLSLRVERDARGLALLWLDARLEGSRGPGSVQVDWRRSDGGGEGLKRLSLAASGLEFSDFEPLWRSLFPGGALAGRVDLTLDMSAGPGLFDLNAEGALHSLALAGGPAWLAGGLRESEVLIAGSCSVDLRDRRSAFHGFRLLSSVFFVEADGTAVSNQGPLGGDLHLSAGIDLARAAARVPALARKFLPALELGGNAELTLAPAERGGFHLTGTVEDLNTRLDARHLLALDQARFETDLQIEPSDRALALERTHLSFPWADLDGRCRIGLNAGFGRLLELEAQLQATLERSAPALYQALGVTPPAQVAGELEAELRLAQDGDLLAGRLRIDSDDFDLRIDPRPGGPNDTYFFRARPLEFEFKGSAAVADPRSTLEGTLALQSETCTVARDEWKDLDVSGDWHGRTLGLNRARAGTPAGGRVALKGTLHFPEDRPVQIRLELEGRQLELSPFTTRLAAVCSPAFAFDADPWNLKGTVRISGHLELNARGLGTTDFLDSLGGSGSLAFSEGELRGSPLLEKLIAPYGRPGPRTITGGGAEFDIRAGRFDVHSWLSWPKRRIESQGWGDTRGGIEYQIPPEALFHAEFMRRYGDLVAPGLFRVSGRISAPDVVLPDPTEWTRLVREGGIEEAIREFRPH